MKIEKINDHQIRCTLTKADLAARQLKLSELAYGTEKAKDLFRDMMQQANMKFGFEAEDIPLMIEAIPLSGECIMLIITKVEDPEELDTRFSKFAPSLQEGDEALEDFISELPDKADEILDLFRKVQESHLSQKTENQSLLKNKKNDDQTEEGTSVKKGALKKEVKESSTKLVSFFSLTPLSSLSYVLDKFYEGNNTLYKDTETGR